MANARTQETTKDGGKNISKRDEIITQTQPGTQLSFSPLLF